MRNKEQKIKINDLELQEKVVAIKRVTKVVEGGRTFGFTAIVVVGDGKGIAGYGKGKAKEVALAVQKAVSEAKKNLVRIPIVRGTIPHDVLGKFKGGKVQLFRASLGTGVIAGGGARMALQVAGIPNIMAKSQGSSNPHNIVKATFQGLAQLRTATMVAGDRGISLAQVFNG